MRKQVADRRVRLNVEALNERITPVVGAFGQAATVQVGQGFDGVVYVQAGAAGVGTGELLPDGVHILTAAHVVADVAGNLKVPNFTVSFDLPNGRFDYVIPAANVTLHPGWATNGGADDLALLTLPSLAPSIAGNAAERYQIYRNTDEVGQDITIVGYGNFGTGETGEQPLNGIEKRIANNRYDALGDQFNLRDALLYDVDDGTAQHDAFGRILGINQTGVPNEGTAARGDSGGPVFVTVNGQRFVAGTTTSGPGANNPPNPAVKNPAVMAGTGSISLDTRISRYAGWIDGIVNANRPLVVDLRQQPLAAGAATTFGVRVVNGNLEVWVNGNLAQSTPLAGVTQLTLIGVGAAADPFTTTATIEASVPLALQITSERITGLVDNRVAAPPPPAPAPAPALPPVPVLPANPPVENRPAPIVNLANVPNALNPTNLVAIGAGGGGGPRVQVYNAQTKAFVRDFFAFPQGFTGGVSVAVGDVNGDFVDDIIVGAGAGGDPVVRVFDGATGQMIRQFTALPTGFRGGVNVASGDVNGDGQDDIVVGAGATGGPVVKVFDGNDSSQLYSFFAFPQGFGGGVNVAAGDVNGDGFSDLIVGAGAGGDPIVRVFDATNLTIIRSFAAYPTGFRGGVFVTAGDLDGDGQTEVITGAGAGGTPTVNVYSGGTLTQTASFLAYDTSLRSGVRVSVTDADGDGLADIAVAPGAGGTSVVRVFKGTTRTQLQQQAAFGGAFLGGVFVGGNSGL